MDEQMGGMWGWMSRWLCKGRLRLEKCCGSATVVVCITIPLSPWGHSAQAFLKHSPLLCKVLIPSQPLHGRGGLAQEAGKALYLAAFVLH